MQRFFTSTMVAMLGLALAGVAEANGPRGGTTGSRSVTHSSSNSNRNGHQTYHTVTTVKNYHMTHGTKASYGYFYRGHNHQHWSYHHWHQRYGCYCYFCPYTTCYYYWCPPDNCYYPVTYTPYGTYTF